MLTTSLKVTVRKCTIDRWTAPLLTTVLSTVGAVGAGVTFSELLPGVALVKFASPAKAKPIAYGEPTTVKALVLKVVEKLSLLSSMAFWVTPFRATCTISPAGTVWAPALAFTWPEIAVEAVPAMIDGAKRLLNVGVARSTVNELLALAFWKLASPA